mmetsp:Transcript_11013/g.22427  ORF Transcript_11013/g.22427 Transcript_11013/m.22427 type:complete len:377 (+) Transcript_11013:167-1297(+)
MRHGLSFVGLLAFGNGDISGVCNNNRIHQTSRSDALNILGGGSKFRGLHFVPAIQLRGGTSETSSMKLSVDASTAMASLLAGSIGGAIGVGASYPFDTLSTKAQVSTGREENHLGFGRNFIKIWKSEGIGGFFDGVLITMIGQAIIKAIQFATNEFTFLWLEKNSSIKSTIIKMGTAGIVSGLVSSFVVSPVELVKVRMQSQNKQALKKKDDGYKNENSFETPKIYRNEIECARWLIKTEGWCALFSHGLWITIIREIPSFAIYFVVYGMLAKSSMAAALGEHMAPLIFGAIAGWAMWIPTYPIDIVKTIEQVQTPKNGQKGKGMLTSGQITAKLYRAGGVMAFFDGLEPKLARAAIKHAVTFWVYEIVMSFIRPA